MGGRERDHGNETGNETYCQLPLGRLKTAKGFYVSIHASSELVENGKWREEGARRENGCTYNLLWLLGIPLPGVLTLKSKNVFDDSTRLSRLGAKVPGASATGGGHLVAFVSLSILDGQEQRRVNKNRHVPLRVGR